MSSFPVGICTINALRFRPGELLSNKYNMALRTICPKIQVLFIILHRIYGLKNSYCLIASTNYFINQQMLNIKGLK